MTIYGKRTALEAISGFRSSGRFPHALLLTGEKGIGKRTLADYAAMLCLCEKQGEKPCMTCNECLRTENHIHPDVLYPLREMPDGKYKVDPLREFIVSCSKKPNDADIRICVFEELDEMSEQCQNTLLTFIEEPLAFNRFIFTAKKKSAVLTTILSRVIELRCTPADKDEFKAALREKNVPADKADELFTLYGGNIGLAESAFLHPEDSALMQKTAEIADFLIAGKEFECAAKLSSLKTREELHAVLGMLTDMFAFAAEKKSGLSKSGAFAEQTDKLSKTFRAAALCELYSECVRLYGKMSANPNLGLWATECSAALFDAMERTR